MDTEKAAGIEMVPVDSSAVSHIGYDPEAHTLRARYTHPGRASAKEPPEYEWSRVTPGQHREIMESASKGRALLGLGTGRRVS